MVGGGAALAGRLEHQVELFAHPLLADELAEVLGAQRGLDRLVLAIGGARHQTVGGARCGLVVPVHFGVPYGQRARLRVWSAARSRAPTLGSAAASACGVTAATASSASRGW